MDVSSESGLLSSVEAGRSVEVPVKVSGEMLSMGADAVDVVQPL